MQRSEAEYIGILDIEATEQYIEKLNFIYPAVDGRIQFIGKLQDELDKSGLPGNSNMNISSLPVAMIFCFIVVMHHIFSNICI